MIYTRVLDTESQRWLDIDMHRGIANLVLLWNRDHGADCAFTFEEIYKSRHLHQCHHRRCRVRQPRHGNVDFTGRRGGATSNANLNEHAVPPTVHSTNGKGKQMTSPKLAATISLTANQLRADEPDSREHGSHDAQYQVQKVPDTVDGIVADIKTHQKELSDAIAARKLNEVHHQAFAIT
jgi:hypothetical protein